MRPFRLFAVALVAALSACAPQRPAEGVKVVPDMEDVRRGQQSRVPADTRGADRPLRPLIHLNRDDRVVSVMNGNLDSDPDQEQVIAVKTRGDVDSRIRLIVADCDSSKGMYYFQSWDAEIGATNPRTFSLSLEDMDGDHGLEIVANGTNAQGKLTLDVFRRNAELQGHGVSFQAVCQISADDVRIERTARSEAYSSGQKNGESFSISSFFRDSESNNVMDLIRVPYTWTYADNRFAPGQPEKIPGEKVQQKILENLYTNESVAYFESFLQGAWIVSGPSGAPSPKGMEIVYFDPKRRRISRYLDDTLETYVWTESNRTIYDRLRVFAENETVRTISRTFSIRATSVNTLEISIQGSDLGDVASAVYVKLSKELQAKYLTPQRNSLTPAPSPINGAYRSVSGVRIAFDGNRLTWTDGPKTRAGVFTTLALSGRSILSVRFTDSYGLPKEIRNFVMETGEKNGIDTLTLSSVQFTVNGLENAPGGPIVLKKIEEEEPDR